MKINFNPNQYYYYSERINAIPHSYERKENGVYIDREGESHFGQVCVIGHSIDGSLDNPLNAGFLEANFQENPFRIINIEEVEEGGPFIAILSIICADGEHIVHFSFSKEQLTNIHIVPEEGDIWGNIANTVMDFKG